MAVLFFDDFTGSGSLDGHAPDSNVAGSGYPATNSARFWVAGGTTTLSSGAMLAGGSGGGGTYSAPTIMQGTHPAAAYAGPFKVTWVWRPKRASTTTEASYALLISVGGGNMTIAPGTTTKQMHIFGAAPVFVTYAADTDYTGTMYVSNGNVTCVFLDQTTSFAYNFQVNNSPFAPIYINLAAENQIKSLTIETIDPFWTDFVNTAEIT